MILIYTLGSFWGSTVNYLCFLFFRINSLNIDTFPETNIAPENHWLGSMKVPMIDGRWFQVLLLFVSRRVCHKHFRWDFLWYRSMLEVMVLLQCVFWFIIFIYHIYIHVKTGCLWWKILMITLNKGESAEISTIIMIYILKMWLCLLFRAKNCNRCPQFPC